MLRTELVMLMASILYPYCNQDAEDAVEAADEIVLEVKRTDSHKKRNEGDA